MKKKPTLLPMLVVLSLWRVCLGEYSPPHVTCNHSTAVSIGDVSDTLKAGVTVFTIQKLKQFNDPTCKEFFHIDGENATLNYNMSQYCEKDFLTCTIECGTPASVFDVRMTLKRSLKYNITVKDQDSYTAQVQEMTPIGTFVKLNKSITFEFDGCIGKDFTQNRSLELVQGPSIVPFIWQAETNLDSLRVNGLIDFETNQSFSLPLKIHYFIVHATATTTISIQVEDIDDNDPRFNINDINNNIDAHYVLKIQEDNSSLVNVPLPTEPKIHAYDPDFGINQTIVYSIIEQKENGLFAINSSTGDFSVTNVLDRDKGDDFYRIVIKAVQSDAATRSAVALVLVTVLDVDDNLPEFKPENYTAEVTEHATSGTMVVQLSAHDLDEGDNSNFTCVLFNTSLPLLVETVSGGCTVRVKDSKSFDREAFPNGMVFQVGANATLRGVLGSNNAMIHLILKDINDNSPNFTSTAYTFSLTNVTNGSIIGKITADDPDEGRNGNVTYLMPTSIIQKEDCDGTNEIALPFYLNRNSGEVTKTSETPSCKLYRTNIEACDNPITNRRCSFTQLTVTNTVSQNGQNTSQAVEIKEDSPIGSYIDALTCNGNGYTYNHDSQEFEVDGASGFIVTSVVLDRENISSYNFHVDVLDQSKTLICGVNVTVTVIDVNDNAPTFIMQPYTFNLPANPADGMTVDYVKAEDDDTGINAEIHYMFYNQQESRFALNETSGEISIRSAAKLVTCDIISLSVTARDSGVPVREAFAQVHIVCHDSNSSVPVSTPLTKQDVENKKEALERDITSILNMTVLISDIQELDDSAAERSRILLSPADPGVTHQQLLESVVMHFEAIRSLFYSPNAQSPDRGTSRDEFGAAEIALVVMGVIILIGTILAIVVVMRQFNSHKRYKQLYESLTRNSSLYESQEIKMKMDDETSDYNGSVKSQDLGSEAPRTPALAVSAVNPGYLNGDIRRQTSVNAAVEPNANTTVKEVIESLERLSDRLEQEDIDRMINEVEPSTTSDNAPLVIEDNSTCNSIDNTDTAPVVYANVAMDDDYENIDLTSSRFGKARNSLEIPATENIELTEVDIETNFNQDEQSPVGDPDETAPGEEEPNPDYDLKQVRFSGEVLDADDNVIQPLKPDKATAPDEASQQEAAGTDQQDAAHATPAAVGDEPGWLEEEIDSPNNTVQESDQGKDFFFVEDALTHL